MTTKLTGALTLLALCNPSLTLAQDKQEPKLFGGWDLTSFTVSSADGKTTAFCEGAYGKLIYEKSGTVSVAINCGPDVSKDSPAAAYGGQLFYAGTFTLHGNTVSHLITNSSSPGLIGKSVDRQVERLSDRSLVLTGKLGPQSLRIEWQRAAPAQAVAPENEIALLTYLKLKPGTEAAFREAFQSIIEPSLSEPGNVAWFVQQSAEDPTSIVFYTRWINEEALKAHLASPPLAQYISQTASMLEPGFPQLVRYKPIDLP